jgi:hypothetical protein
VGTEFASRTLEALFGSWAIPAGLTILDIIVFATTVDAAIDIT